VQMRSRRVVVLAVLLGVLLMTSGARLAGAEGGYEVWAIDQSDTTPTGGGTLYVYDGASLAGQAAAAARPEVIDLGGPAEAFCLARTGTVPRRPHMLLFDDGGTHAILSYVLTGHVAFLDAGSKEPVGCVDVGVQAHAAFPSPDESYVVVANQNGKLLQRITTDYATNTFTLDTAATLDLASCTTPNGAPCEDATLRPDNAPICPVVDSTSTFTLVTLRGGGLFVVDSSATPMAIVAEYDRVAVHPNGCGGVQTGGKMYITSGGGTGANPLESDLYAFPMAGFSRTPAPPNTPAPAVVFSRDTENAGFVDTHGALLTKHERYLWVGDRAANTIVVVDTATDEVVDVIQLAGTVSQDPAPDLMALSPAGNRAFIAFRGPNPLTANVPGVNNAVGGTPGVGIVRVERGGGSGTLQALAPISHVVGGVERADPHAIAVRQR